MKNIKAKEISRLVNDCSFYGREVGIELSTDHRTLQESFAKCAMSFFGCLAANYDKGYYDGRNEYACQCAKVMIQALEGAGLWYESYEKDIREDVLNKMWA